MTDDTIAACGGLDGKVDGVVSRTDLCRLRYNTSASVGKPYSCAASTGFGGPRAPPPIARRQFPGAGPAPAVQGTVSAEAAAVADDITRGIFDSKGRQVYVSFQPGAGFADGITTYDGATARYTAVASGIGVQYVNLFLREIDSGSLSLQNVTYDTLRGWILQGMQKFSDTLQTTWPDLEDFRNNGGKVIHYHGEADNSIPASASTIYHEVVRRVMYPGMGFDEGYQSLHDWYRLFLVPGAGHCGPSIAQPGPFPTNLLQNVID